MVKKIFCICIVLVLLFVFTVPSFAFDNFQSDTDSFGFAYNDSKIYFFNKELAGNCISVDNQIVPVTRIYLYVPCTTVPKKLEVFYSFMITTGSIYMSACDYGTIYANAYHITASLPNPGVTWVGTSTISGSSARYFSCKSTFNSLPFSGSVGGRYIRMTIDVDTQYATAVNLVTFLNKDLEQHLSGVLGNPTYSLTATQGDHVGTVTSGSLTESGYYITGSLKNKYYNGSSVQTNTGTLTSGTTGTGGYLWVPSHTITATASSPLKMNISGGNISGTLSPSSASQNTDLQGTYLDRTYVNTVTLNASRQYDDSELIDAVNDASDRNHADLGRIEDQMQEVVDHMQGLEQQGNEINGTTSQSTINNATGVVNTGTSSMSDTANYVSSGVTSGSAESQGYVQLLGYGVGEIVDFGSSSTPLGVWIWAIIFIPVAFFIFRRISE